MASRRRFNFWQTAAMLGVLLLARPAFCDDSVQQLSQDYPPGSIASTETADQALQRAAEARSVIEQRFARDQQACYSKFFAGACLDDARESRRVATNRVKRVEIEAGEFQRRARAEEHDRAEAERIAEERKRAAAADAPSENERIAAHEAKLKDIEEQERADAAKRESNIAAYEKKVRDSEARRKQALEKKSRRESSGEK